MTNVQSQARAKVAPAVAFRSDVQGLRAIAVVVVIFDHLFGWPAGGFVGVDVFFVISGFLITGLMLREHATTGRISWVGFYKRRVRRIVPAATACLLIVLAASYLVYRSARFDAIRTDAIWSFLFVSNWHYASQGTDYLQASGPVSPLQHFWSLSVEEQFYVTWPVLLIVALGLIGRRLRVHGRSVASFLAVAVALVAAASFAWACAETNSSPTWAYFSTFSRGWELAVGALLAVGAVRLARIPSAIRPALSLTGLALIGTSLFLITPTSSFPGPWAALPVLGAALVLAAGVSGTPRYSAALTNIVSVYIGKISYSLYLWHFPVIIILAALIASDSFVYYIVTVGLIAGLAIASFHLVEDPVRRSSWLQPQPHARRRKTSHGPFAVLGHMALGMLTVSVLAASVVALQGPLPYTTASPVDEAAPPALPSGPGVSAVAGGAQAALSTEIDAALDTTDWPDLNPSIDDVISPDNWSIGCSDQSHACTSNTAATKTAYILGDSTAQVFSATVREALWNDYNVTSLTLQQCPVAPVGKAFVSEDQKQGCEAGRLSNLEQVATVKPDVVFLMSSYVDLLSGATGDAATAEWAAADATVLPQIAASAGKVILVSPPPVVKSLAECATATSRPPACVSRVPDMWTDLASADTSAAAAAGAAFWDTTLWYCSTSGPCPSFVGTTPVRQDKIHLTRQYSAKLVPVFSQKFAQEQN